MRTNLLKSILFLALPAMLLTSCVNDDDYSVPTLECNDPGLVATKTVAEIRAAATSAAVQYTADDIIEGRVVSSDRGGNFYKVIYLNSLDGEQSFSVAVNQTDLYGDYNVGRKVYIKLKDLYVQVRSNTLQIGALYNNNVGQIGVFDYADHLVRSCESVDEETLVNHITLDEVSDAYIGKLIEISGVQFTNSSLGQNYYNPSNVVGSETNHYITDTFGNELIFRTGSFAEYSGYPVSANSGSIRGVLTKFNNDLQFVARYATDIKLTETRLEQPAGPSETALGGTEVAFTGAFTETFESFAADEDTFPAYINDAVVGTRYWQVKTFGGNKYIQMSSFNAGGANRVLYFVPVDFTAASTFSFKTKDGFNNGAALKVYYTTDYIALTDATAASYTDITSSFTIASGTNSGYATNFTNSGNYAIPASLTGNGYFVFEYIGSSASGGVTTTMQIDDITVQ